MAGQEGTPAGARDRLTAWIGVAGSLVTVVLTAWNAYTKSQIDAREASLKELELELKRRSAGVEESKERVDRYKWVLGLFPDVTGSDARKRNFTIGLIQLALTKEEADELFAGLNASQDTALQAVGRSGIAATEIAPIARLVAQTNAASADARKSAVAELLRDYEASTDAVTLVLRTYEPDRVGQLSPSGVINGLYFLGGTAPSAWTPEQARTARQLVATVAAWRRGPQTEAALDALRKRLAALPP